MNRNNERSADLRQSRRRERPRLTPNPKSRLREQVHEVMRFLHFSQRTEDSYWQWIMRYLRFHRRGHGTNGTNGTDGAGGSGGKLKVESEKVKLGKLKAEMGKPTPGPSQEGKWGEQKAESGNVQHSTLNSQHSIPRPTEEGKEEKVKLGKLKAEMGKPTPGPSQEGNNGRAERGASRTGQVGTSGLETGGTHCPTLNGWRHPRDMGAAEVNAFLSHLAVEKQVAAATQNQALNALVFLYGEVLHEPLGEIGDFVRVQRPARLPEVLSRAEVARVLGAVEADYALALQLLYGSGLRLMELLRLRVHPVR